MKCKECKYWESFDDDCGKTLKRSSTDIDDNEIGACHRYPPIRPNIDNVLSDDFACTLANEWCGEFEAK